MGKDGSECCESNGCCEETGCGGQEQDVASMLLHLADEAWAELMKEKMKAAFEKHTGDKMNKASAAAVEASIAYWSNKTLTHEQLEAHKRKIHDAMK